MVSGRVICPVSANGRRTARPAPTSSARSKGYQRGKSLDTEFRREPARPKVLIPGRARKPGDCRTDNYVTNALCQ